LVLKGVSIPIWYGLNPLILQIQTA